MREFYDATNSIEMPLRPNMECLSALSSLPGGLVAFLAGSEGIRGGRY